MRKRTSQSLQGLYTIAIAMVFLAGFLLLVIFGAVSYQSTSGSQQDNNHTRALLSYLVTSSKTNDAGSLSVMQDEFGDVLVISDGDTGYGLRIYCYEGNLVEDYNALDKPLYPKEANVIAANETFSVSYKNERLIEVTTDEGTVLLNVRVKEAAQ